MLFCLVAPSPPVPCRPAHVQSGCSWCIHLPSGPRVLASAVMVEEGATVAAGDPLMVMIAMKMEYVIKAPAAGTVSRVADKPGDFVEKNKVLVAFQAEE